MLAEASGGLTAAIKARDYVTVRIHVHDRSRPCCVERWLGDLIERRWLAEVVICSRVNEGVVSGNSMLEIFGRHRNTLISHFGPTSEIAETVGAEEEPGFGVDVRWCGIPPFAGDGVRVEDGPDWTAAIITIADSSECCIDEVVWIVLGVFGI